MINKSIASFYPASASDRLLSIALTRTSRASPVLGPTKQNPAEALEETLRPRVLHEYIGQGKIKDHLLVHMGAARTRNEPLGHTLLHGPPGLGKTTLAHIIAQEMGAQVRVTSGPAIEKPGDLAALLTNLSQGDVLFIDEIHRLNRQIEEVLYPAMEDFALDLVDGDRLGERFREQVSVRRGQTVQAATGWRRSSRRGRGA